MAKTTLFELETKRATLAEELSTVKEFILEKTSDPNFPMEELEAKQKTADEYTKRIGMLDAAIKEAKERQKKLVAMEHGDDITEKQMRIKAKADFYRAVFGGGDIQKAYEGLGAIPAANADLGSGDKLLPTNLSNELLMEPVDVNPLRAIVHVTNITGLEEPKLGFTIENADLADVTDKQTANEIKMEGDTVTFGRSKMKVSATLKDTVYHGTDLDVVNAVEGALRSALAKREKHFAFLPDTACATDTAHAHMSFYNKADGAYVIGTKTGATMYAAIVAALADLADDFAANARVVMKKSDYYEMIQTLTNDSEALFGSKPASVLGYPVTFCDKATIPVVGDFSYYGINYDIGAVYETDKDAKKGEYYFVLTAWGDQKIRLKSAFRLAMKSGE